MSLRFSFLEIQVPQPVPSLGGKLLRPRPVVPVTLIGPRGSKVADALIDTGSDDSVFPERLALSVGIDLAQAPLRTVSGLNQAKS